MIAIETKIKAQYAIFFQSEDWKTFKQLAEHYLDVAVHLKKKDVNSEEPQLWLRNVQKRLFIGVACELLLKAYYLKQGYGINTNKKGGWKPYRIQDINPDDYDKASTFTMNFLLDQLHKEFNFDKLAVIDRGFRIAKVFRNKEAHVATYWHKYDANDYSYIENALIAFYDEAFDELLEIQISFEKGENGIFIIKKIPSNSGV